METIQEIQISYDQTTDGRVSYNVSTRISDEETNVFHVIINDLNRDSVRLPGSDAAIIDFYRLDPDTDPPSGANLNEEDLTYRMSVYDHTLTSSASIVEIEGNNDGDDEKPVEIATIEQKVRPMSCVFDVIAENTNIQFSAPPCQLSLIFPCTQDNRNTMFNTSNGSLITRHGNNVGCAPKCCGRSVVEANTISYTVQFSESATVESKRLIMFGCMFVEYARFSNNMSHTEYVTKKLDD